MYDMLSNATLAQTVNQFPVPMYVLEQAEDAVPFKFAYINDAMEQALLCDRWDVIGKSLDDALPAEEKSTAQRRLAHCVQSQKVMRFCDRFSITTDRVLWDTTLQPVPLSDGRQRVVATCIQQETPLKSHPENVAFDDIQYFSSLADFQIQNLISMFEACEARELFENEAEQRIARLSGMCRTVQVAVAEIRKSVRTAQSIQKLSITRNTLPALPPTQVLAKLERCGTMKALTDISTK